MEELVLGGLSLVKGTLSWGLANALPLAVGSVVGGPLARTTLGLVGDVLGRTKEVVGAVSDAVAGK